MSNYGYDLHSRALEAMINAENYMIRSALNTKHEMDKKQELMGALLDLKTDLNSIPLEREKLTDEIICTLNTLEDRYGIRLSRENVTCLRDEIDHHVEKIKLELQSTFSDIQELIVKRSAVIEITKTAAQRDERKKIIDLTGRV